MSKPVVLLAEKPSPATIEALGPDFEVRTCDGGNRTELLTAVVDADALVVRSATKVNSEVFSVARQLQVVARAGVGLDNIDVATATAAGVMVVNAPSSNVTSAAELAIGLLLASARNIPAADATLRGGQWKRNAFTGVELLGKTLGLLGLGRIGALVAARLAAFDMQIIAYDPYVSQARAGQLGVRLTTLDEVLMQSDFISVHLPKTPETIGLIGARELGLMKPSAILINAARGAIVEEAALYEALDQGWLAGAGLDVYSTEPMTDSPLFGLPNVVVTPHLGASTHEAQEKAGSSVAKSVRLALAGDLVPDAVNVSGGTIAEQLRSAIPLAEVLGSLLSGLAGAIPTSLTVEVRGELAALDVRVLELATLKGLFANVVDEHVTYVNAPLLAQERGVAVNTLTTLEDEGYRSSVLVRGTTEDGEIHSLTGTLAGKSKEVRVVDVSGFDVEFIPARHLAFLEYKDRPGVIGTVGGILGLSKINIAMMQVSRRSQGGQVLMAMTVDSAIPAEVMERIVTDIGASAGRTVSLPNLPN